MIRGREHRTTSGLTLVELLVSIGIINAILVMGGICFAEMIRMRGARDRYHGKLAAAEYLLRSVERDVKGARGILIACGDYRADDKTLILRRQDGEVIYLVDGGKVRRVVQSGDQPRDEVVINAPGVHISFDLETPPPEDARSVVTTVEWEEKPEIGVSHPALSLRVALRERE